MMKKFIFIFVMLLIASVSWAQTNDLLDGFLERETADVATALLLVAQASGEITLDTTGNAGYEWAVKQSFGKYVEKVMPEDDIGLGLFYLALFNTFDVKGGNRKSPVKNPRYAAFEAEFLGYAEPSRVFTDRAMPPYEVLTAISYVTAVEPDSGSDK